MRVTVMPVAGQPYRQRIVAGRHVFYADAGKAHGGQDSAPSPHDMALGALGACTAMTMQMVANRKGWPLQGVKVRVGEHTASAGGHTPAESVITKEIVVKGALTPQQLSALETIAEKCPINKLLTGHKSMKTTFNLEA